MKVCIFCKRKYPDGDITFHRIPSDENRRQEWLNAMKLFDEQVYKNSYLCSEHFAKDTFCCQVVNKVLHRFLHLNAVPSIFLEEQRQCPENETLINDQTEGIKERQNNSVQVSKECLEQEDTLQSNKENLNGNVNKKTEELIHKTLDENSKLANLKANAEESVKIEMLPEIRNGEIYSDNVCDFKTVEFNNNDVPNIIYEDIRMDAEEIPYEQVIEYFNINEINEVEVTTCETEQLELDEQVIPVLENQCMKGKEVKEDTEKKYKNGIVNSDVEELKKHKKDNVKKTSIVRKNSQLRDKHMKQLLYEWLKKNRCSDIHVKLQKYDKSTLIELLKTALNYIECLDEKLKISMEKNNLQEQKITTFKNLLESSSTNDTSKTT